MIQIDPTQNKSEHCKVYLEKDLKDAIVDYQRKRNLFSFSEAARQLMLLGLNAEIQGRANKKVASTDYTTHGLGKDHLTHGQ